MKNMKSLLYLLAVAAAGFFTACSDSDEYVAGGENGMGVFFPATLPSEVELSEGQTSLTIPVMRSQSTEAYTMDVLGACTTANGIFTFPTEITFAAGESEKQLVITFDKSKLEEELRYYITVALGDSDNISNYGMGTYNFAAVLVGPWTSLGKAIYSDGILCSLFGWETATYEVEIEESGRTSGLYRLKNPYGDTFSSIIENTVADWADMAGTAYDTYIQIDASDPNKVFIAPQPIGRVLNTYGEPTIGTITEGKLEKGVITFPVQGLFVEIPESDNAGKYYANNSGQFRVVLPGASLTNPTVKVTYQGTYLDKRGNSSAILEFAPNEDVQKIYYTVVQGNISRDQEALAAQAKGMLDGTIADTKIVTTDGNTASVNELYPLEVSDKYTVVAVPVGQEDGQMIEGETVGYLFTFVAGGEKPEIVSLQEGYYIFSTGEDDKGTEYFNTIAVSEIEGGDGTEWKVENLFDYPGFMYATYNEEEGSLTLDGKASLPTQSQGMQDVDFFGEFYFNYDEAGTMASGIFCFTEEIKDQLPGNGKSPWILLVDPTTGYLYQTENYLYDLVGKIEGDQITDLVGFANITVAGTAVEYTEEAPASLALSTAKKLPAPIAMNFSSVSRMHHRMSR